MKKLIPFITPIVLAAFIYSTMPEIARAGDPPTTCAVAYSTDLQTWVDLPFVDLSTAVVNPVTGQKEIRVEVEVPYSVAMDTAMFFKSSSDNIKLKYLNTPIVVNGPQPLAIGCAGIIIAVMVIIVAGIIIYYLIKTCRRLLPPTPPPATNVTMNAISPFMIAYHDAPVGGLTIL
jgi:hypothetical protein